MGVGDLARVAVAGGRPHVADSAAEGLALLPTSQRLELVRVGVLGADGHRGGAGGLEAGAVGLGD